MYLCARLLVFCAILFQQSFSHTFITFPFCFILLHIILLLFIFSPLYLLIFSCTPPSCDIFIAYAQLHFVFFVATVLVFTISPASLASPALLRNHLPQFPEKTFFHRPFKVSLCMCSWCHALPTCSSSNFRINYSKHVLASVYCHECD